jgi:hypothetical protein
MASFIFVGPTVGFSTTIGIFLCLQPLNCSLLTLLGMRKLAPEGQETSDRRAMRGRLSWVFLKWRESNAVWTILMLGFLTLFLGTFPLPGNFVYSLPTQPLHFVGPWFFYYVDAFIEAMVVSGA